jgi:hypothetical protein
LKGNVCHLRGVRTCLFQVEFHLGFICCHAPVDPNTATFQWL